MQAPVPEAPPVPPVAGAPAEGDPPTARAPAVPPLEGSPALPEVEPTVEPPVEPLAVPRAPPLVCAAPAEALPAPHRDGCQEQNRLR